MDEMNVSKENGPLRMARKGDSIAVKCEKASQVAELYCSGVSMMWCRFCCM